MSESRGVSAFDKKAEAWEDYTASPLGRLRRELTLCRLAQHLLSCPRHLAILDAGAGTGDYALALVQQGHRVCLLDFSSRMLAIAKRKVERIDVSLSERLVFLCASAEEICECFPPGHFDVVLCHTLLEYVSEPWEVLRALTMVLRRGGLLSLLLVNPRVEALRCVLTEKDPAKACLALCKDASPAGLFGLPRRIFPSEMIHDAMAREEIEVVAQYGVRIFADYLPPENLADGKFLAQLVELEMRAGGLDPYRLIGRYTHLLGRKVDGTSRRPQEVSI